MFSFSKALSCEISSMELLEMFSTSSWVQALMEPTEEVLKKTFYINGFYFTELSRFPTLNHSKNHFYFEMMRGDANIASNEWFIPKAWKLPEAEQILAEKQAAVAMAEALYDRCAALKDRLEEGEYEKLLLKFANLKLVTRVWQQLAKSFLCYVNALEVPSAASEAALEEAANGLLALKEQGIAETGEDFYCLRCDGNRTGQGEIWDYIGTFVKELRESYLLEKQAREELAEKYDFIVCGGALEGHGLQKEVNFSDTLVRDDALCRIPGNRSGLQWSRINAHGWFSYLLRVRPYEENRITVSLSSAGKDLDVKITLGQREFDIREPGSHRREITLPCVPDGDTLRIRFDKISGNTPCIHAVWVACAK